MTPDLDFREKSARFSFSGKSASVFRILKSFRRPARLSENTRIGKNSRLLNFPSCSSSTGGGEGETVFLVSDDQKLKELVRSAARYENESQRGFLIQEFIPSGSRTLRIVIIGRKIMSYWKIAENGFLSTLSKGAKYESDLNPECQHLAQEKLTSFCGSTGINLAAFDFLFSEKRSNMNLYFIEINYFFGRRGIGGSHAYYRLLEKAVQTWLEEIGQRPALG